MARPGKKLEGEIYTAFKHIGNWNHNANNPNPVTDRLACYKGLSVMVECKETHGDKLAFSELSKNQRDHLKRHAASMGITLVAIQRIFPGDARTWLCPWWAWEELEATLGRASIPLEDGKRPPHLHEVFRIERPNSLGTCWDLEPLLEAWWDRGVRNLVGQLT